MVSIMLTHELKNIIDAIPSYVFVVDEDVRIIEYNSQAAKLLIDNRESVIFKRGGEVLHCLHSHEVLGGCGRAPACIDCIIRISVNRAFGGDKVTRIRAKIEIENNVNTTEIFTVITASQFIVNDRTLVLLLIEDISELIAIQNIVPICMKCKKVQSVDKFWTALESYFKSNWGIDFSHGYCPECVKVEMEHIKKYISDNK